MKQSYLNIESFQNNIHHITGKVLRTDSTRAKGLMYRRSNLGPNRGILFHYSKDSIKSVWMKNTYIPLDILFLDSKMKVLDLYKSMIPHSLKTISSNKLCRHFIEIDEGEIERLSIKIGDIIETFEEVKTERKL